MGTMRLLKLGLFIYELIRIMVLAAYVFMQPFDPVGLPRLLYAGSGVLFPLMAMFIWLDVSRYKAYLPLFMAGKCISIFILAAWLVISRRLSIPVSSPGISISESLILCGDLLALTAVLLIIKDENKADELQAEEK